MTIVSLLGYSNSGKTMVAEAIVREALHRGLRCAAVKVGHPSTGERSAGPRDTDRMQSAGATVTAFRTPQGWTVEIHDPMEGDWSAPLELPPWLTAMVHHMDVLVVEGRQLPGAVVVQTVGKDGTLKVPRNICDVMVENAPEQPLPPELVTAVFRSEKTTP